MKSMITELGEVTPLLPVHTEISKLSLAPLY